jgi:hypothetical protein
MCRCSFYCLILDDIKSSSTFFHALFIGHSLLGFFYRSRAVFASPPLLNGREIFSRDTAQPIFIPLGGQLRGYIFFFVDPSGAVTVRSVCAFC